MNILFEKGLDLSSEKVEFILIIRHSFHIDFWNVTLRRQSLEKRARNKWARSWHFILKNIILIVLQLSFTAILFRACSSALPIVFARNFHDLSA